MMRAVFQRYHLFPASGRAAKMAFLYLQDHVLFLKRSMNFRSPMTTDAEILLMASTQKIQLFIMNHRGVVRSAVHTVFRVWISLSVFLRLSAFIKTFDFSSIIK